MRVLLLVVTLSLAGCAAGMHNAAKVEDVAHDGLMAFDRALDTRCDAGELTPATCKELNGLLVPVWDFKNNLNRAIAGSGGSMSLRIADFRTAISALMTKVTQLVQGGAQQILLRELNLAVMQVP